MGMGLRRSILYYITCLNYLHSAAMHIVVSPHRQPVYSSALCAASVRRGGPSHRFVAVVVVVVGGWWAEHRAPKSTINITGTRAWLVACVSKFKASRVWRVRCGALLPHTTSASAPAQHTAERQLLRLVGDTCAGAENIYAPSVASVASERPNERHHIVMLSHLVSI